MGQRNINKEIWFIYMLLIVGTALMTFPLLPTEIAKKFVIAIIAILIFSDCIYYNFCGGKELQYEIKIKEIVKEAKELKKINCNNCIIEDTCIIENSCPMNVTGK